MSGRAVKYTIRHLELDGATIDREDAYPPVHFELVPVGTGLPITEQQYELVITIGLKSVISHLTRLDADAVAQLIHWLTYTGRE